MGSPMVSCLCVSRPARWGQLQRAILDFTRQTYDYRELLVVVDNATDYGSTVQSFVDEQADNRIRVLPRLAKSQLDGLQYAATAAFGSILALWDDDNLNHPTRLAVQVARQINAPNSVTVLTEGMYYFYQDDELFVVDCFKPDAQAAERVLPTTLMAFRDHFPVLEPAVRGKPSEQMVNALAKSGRRIYPISGAPFLHMVGIAYTIACPHTRTYQFHRKLVERCARSVDWLYAKRAALTEALDSYAWNGRTVNVEGHDGGAFLYDTKTHWSPTLYPVRTEEDTPQTLPAELTKT